MDKKQFKRRKKILQDISLGRYVFYLQPLLKTQDVNRSSVEVLPYYHTYSSIKSIQELRKDLEKDISIVIFDLFVFEKICEVIYMWRQKQIQPIRFHIRLSSITIEQCDLDKQLEVIRNRYHVIPQDIGIIVSYQKNVQVQDTQLEVIDRLHQQGYLMILDSEENGHLDLLAKAMFSMVKFDFPHFIKDMKLERSMSYFYYILKWCREENVEIMFGGIQNEQQREYTLKMGCAYMAAPYLQTPLALEEFEFLLMRQQLVNSYEN